MAEGFGADAAVRGVIEGFVFGLGQFVGGLFGFLGGRGLSFFLGGLRGKSNVGVTKTTNPVGSSTQAAARRASLR